MAREGSLRPEGEIGLGSVNMRPAAQAKAEWGKALEQPGAGTIELTSEFGDSFQYLEL